MKRSRGLTLANLFRSGNTKVPYFQIGFDIQDCVSPIRVSGDATAGGDCKCCSTRIFQFDAKRLAAGIRFSQYLRSIMLQADVGCYASLVQPNLCRMAM
jgi:hypothetical protein